MIRVLHVLPWIRAGGVERRRAAIVEQLSDDYEHRFFALRADRANADRIQEAGAPIVTARDETLANFRAFFELAKLVKNYRPHIIHGAVFEGVILAATVGRLMRVPVVIGEETSFATNRSPRGHALFRGLSMLTDRTVAISPQVEEMLKDTTHVAPKKVALVMNGVDPLPAVSAASRRAARAHFGLSDDDFVLGTMSRLVNDDTKRVSDILRAMHTLRETLPQARLLICGDGRDRPMLQELAQRLGVDDVVIFAGNVQPEQGFHAMDVFVHVAEREGFGLAVAEAAFCALPMVTTGVGGIASIVLPNESALMVPVGDVDAIAAAVQDFAADDKKRRQFGKAGRAYAVDRFSSARYVRDVEQLYRQLLHEKKVRV